MATLSLTVNATAVYAEVDTDTGVLPLAVQVEARTSTVENDPSPSAGGPWEDVGADTFEDHPDHVVHYVWDFGDDLSDEECTHPLLNQFVNTNDAQHGPHAMHVYTREGTYTITCTGYYRDPNSETIISATDTITVNVLSATHAGWETVYVDTNNTDSTGAGTIDNPFTTLAQLQGKIDEHGHLAVFIAVGSVLLADTDGNGLDITNLEGLRIQKYVPSDATTSQKPIIRLDSSNASATACISIVGDADDDSDNEVQTCTITNATGGSFFIRYYYWDATNEQFTFEDTSDLGYDDSASNVQSALELLSNIGSGQVSVTKPGTSEWDIEFTGTLADTNVLLAEAITSFTDPLTGSDPTAAIVVDTNGSPGHTKVSDVFISDVVLDGNTAADSRGIEIVRGGTAKGYSEYVYFSDCYLSSYTAEGLFVENALNTAATFGPQFMGAVRSQFDSSIASGHTCEIACKQHFAMIGCSFRGGDGDIDADNHVEIVEFTGNEAQEDYLFRWCGTIASSAKKRHAFHLQGGLSKFSMYGCAVTGVRNGVYIDRTGASYDFPTNFIIDGCSFNNIGLSSTNEARAIVMVRASNVSIRNTLFYDNGYANGAADADGQDILIDDASGDEGADVTPIRIYHNSFYRSYSRAGAPFIDVDDLRYVSVYNNAMVTLGGVGPGSPPNNPGRSLVRFTSASYMVPQRDDTQRIEITGSPTGGSYKLSFNSGAEITNFIAYDASAATIQSELEGLASIGAGNVEVTEGPGPDTPYIVRFTGVLAGSDQDLLVLDTNSLTGGSTPSVSLTTLVDGSAGYTFFDGNYYHAPNLVRSGVVAPFVIDGSTFLQFDAASGDDWSNGGNSDALDSVDVHGAMSNPLFRNPGAGNFQFSSGDPLHDAAVDSLRDTIFDYRGVSRSTDPDVGAYEYDSAGGVIAYSYAPASLAELPVANAVDYQDGGVQYIETLEPVVANPYDDPDFPNDVDNRPHKNLAHRDNVLGDRVDALLTDVNSAFCAPPQSGSAFLSPHTTIESFIRVGHNEDGTVKLDALDLSGLGFLRIDGSNYMLADLDMGDGTNRLVNMARGASATDGVRYDQVITLQDGGIIESTAVVESQSGASFDFGANILQNVGEAVGDTDAPQLGQVVKKIGDEMTGDLVMNDADIRMSGNTINMGWGPITNLAQGTSAGEAVRFDQVILRNGTYGMLANLSMTGHRIAGLGAAVNSDEAPRMDQVVLRDGSSVMTGELKAYARIDMNSSRIRNVGAAVSGSDAPRFDQVVSVAGDTMTGTLVMSDGFINFGADAEAEGSHHVTNLNKGTSRGDSINKGQLDDAVSALQAAINNPTLSAAGANLAGGTSGSATGIANGSWIIWVWGHAASGNGSDYTLTVTVNGVSRSLRSALTGTLSSFSLGMPVTVTANRFDITAGQARVWGYVAIRVGD